MEGSCSSSSCWRNVVVFLEIIPGGNGSSCLYAQCILFCVNEKAAAAECKVMMLVVGGGDEAVGGGGGDDVCEQGRLSATPHHFSWISDKDSYRRSSYSNYP